MTRRMTGAGLVTATALPQQVFLLNGIFLILITFTSSWSASEVYGRSLSSTPVSAAAPRLNSVLVNPGGTSLQQAPAQTTTFGDKSEDLKSSAAVSGKLPFFKSDKLRYPDTMIFLRTPVAIAACVLNIPYWDSHDWAAVGLTAAGTLAFMAPTDPSPDARLQFWIVKHQYKVLDYAMPALRTKTFSPVAVAVMAGLWGGGWLFGNDGIKEWGSLAIEALIVAQSMHVAQKLTMGREGPTQGDGLGIVYGPSKGPELWPSGTPSGHTASVVAVATLTMMYFDNPWVDAAAYFAGGYIMVSVLYNNQHFISDVIWGAPLGYFIGKWVYDHHSSKMSYHNGVPKKRPGKKKALISFEYQGIMPWTHPWSGAQGLSALWKW